MKALPLSPKLTYLRPGSVVLLSSSVGLRELTLRSIRPLGSHFSISFLGIDDRESAFCYRDSLLKVRKDSIPLHQGEFFWDDLIGLKVLTLDGELIGKVEGIIETGSNDVYIVRGEGREYLVPAIKDVVREIDCKGGKIVVKVMEGMLD